MKHCWGVTVKLTDKKSSQDLFWIAAVYLVQVVACEHSCLLSFPVASSLSEETTSRMTKPKARAWVAAFLERKKKQLGLRGCSKNKLSLVVCHLTLRIVSPGSHGIFLTCVARMSLLATHQWFQTWVLHKSCAYGVPEKKSKNSLQDEVMCCWRGFCVMHGFSLNLTSKYYCL